MAALVVLALAAFFAAYALFAGRLLASHLTSSVEGIGIEFDAEEATSLVPGSLTLSGVHVADTGGEFSVNADHVVCEFDLLPFLFGRSEIDLLRADGVVMEIPGSLDPPLWRSARLPEPRNPVIGSSIASRALPVPSDGIVVSRIDASGTRFTLGKYELRGSLRYEATNVHLADSATVEQGTVDVSDANVHRNGELLGSVDGRVHVSAPEDEAGSGSSLWQRARAHIELEGRVDSLAPWIGKDESALSVTGASHHVELEFEDGSLKLGRIRLRAARASFAHVDESETRISNGVKLSVRLGSPVGQRADLSAGTISLLDTEGRRWAQLSDFRAGVQPSAALRARTSTGETRLVLSTAQAQFQAFGATIDAPLEGNLPVEYVDLRRGALSLGPGALRIPSGQLSAPKTGESYEFEAGLAISKARLSADGGFAFEGRAHVRGEDADMLLDIAHASETVRWTLSMLEGQPFVVRGNITREAHGLMLDPVSFESGTISASGALIAASGTTKGAFLVQGPLPVGVLLEQQGVSAEVPVDAEWLAERLTVLRTEERDISARE